LFLSFYKNIYIYTFTSTMGNLLKALNDKSGKRAGQDFFIDFEDAKPTDGEKVTFDKVQAVLNKSKDILAELEAYSGAGDFIRHAISNPNSEDLQVAAWNAVCPLVTKLKTFYDYSSEVETALPELLTSLCMESPLEALEKYQALAKQCAETLSFVIKFDDLKMSKPEIQNDFSYYRRTLSRKKMQEPSSDDNAVVNNEEANRMSLFYAYPTPMLRTVSESTTKFVTENKEIPLENTTDCLAMISTVCRVMVESNNYYDRFTNKDDTIKFCQRVMVAAVILYDHVHHLGAFKKGSAIDIKHTIKSLKMHNTDTPEGEAFYTSMMNALRYTTKHLNDDDTPKQVKALFAN